MKDYYEILQVHPRADPEAIQSAYRRLRRKYRPEADTSPEARERLREINEAYEALSDAARRAEYDSRRSGQGDAAADSVPRHEAKLPVARAAPPSAAVLERAQQAVAVWAPTSITTRQLLLVGLLTLALFTRFWRLDTPADKMFDEVYFATTGQEILHGDRHAWDFIGHENTHPPLSKLLMAGGMAVFGENSFGWRFFGALAGAGSVVFIYLLGRRLFKSEFVGLAAAFLLLFDGLAFTQARIATPDTYVLFFVLGCVYFLVADRHLLSGIFLGAALACKWTALFTVLPIVLYFLYRYWQTERGKGAQLSFLAPLSLLAFYLGTPFLFGELLIDSASHLPSLSAPLFGMALVVWMLLSALAPVAIFAVYRLVRPAEGRDRARAVSLLTLPLFFIVVPLYVYSLTYLPMLVNGLDLNDVWELNKGAYLFHSTLEATHPYQAPWDTWPILKRPVYFYLGSDEGKIYNLGNPIIFWFGLPALAFTLWQGLRGVRAKLDPETGDLSVWGTLRPENAALLFVVLTYLAFWLTWARQPRIMFLYHYLNAMPFLILALAYAVSRLWQERIWERISPIAAFLAAAGGTFLMLAMVSVTMEPRPLWARPFLAIGVVLLLTLLLAYVMERRWQLPWGRTAAVAFLAVVAATFVYFYPHLASVSVSRTLDESYFWFSSWR